MKLGKLFIQNELFAFSRVGLIIVLTFQARRGLKHDTCYMFAQCQALSKCSLHTGYLGELLLLLHETRGNQGGKDLSTSSYLVSLLFKNSTQDAVSTSVLLGWERTL